MITSIHQSMINSWELCPERFRRRYIDGEIIPPGIAARIGTGLHKGAEVNHIQKIKTGKDEPLEVIQDAARDGYTKALENGVFFCREELGSAKKQMAGGLDHVVTMAKLYRESLAPQVQPVLAEKTIEHQVDGLPVPFVGTVDVFTSDGWLPDIKTAAKKWSQGKADTSPQPTIYRELIRHETGRYPDKMSFEVFTKTKTPVHQSVITTRQSEDFQVLIYRAKIMLQMIEQGIFPPAPADSWTCSQKWCGFYFTCPHIPKYKQILKAA